MCKWHKCIHVLFEHSNSVHCVYIINIIYTLYIPVCVCACQCVSVIENSLSKRFLKGRMIKLSVLTIAVLAQTHTHTHVLNISVLKSASCLLLLFSTGDTAGSCGDPGIPSHGSREQTDFKIRSKVYFSCSEGFDLIGSSERMCFPNGTWSGTQPFCKRRNILLLSP